MFVQIIEGDVADRERLHSQFDRWREQLRPSAPGFLGVTEGVTDDGHFIGLACFESADAARANSERPEQDAWWRETVSCFRSSPTLVDTTETDTFLAGPSNKAGFVQVLQGGPSNRDRMHELDSSIEPLLKEQRPEVIGGLRAWHPDGHFTEAVYFTTEEAARAGESQPTPPEVERVMGQQMAESGEVKFLDLHNPWLVA